jgi:hypothetical protein
VPKYHPTTNFTFLCSASSAMILVPTPSWVVDVKVDIEAEMSGAGVHAVQHYSKVAC